MSDAASPSCSSFVSTVTRSSVSEPTISGVSSEDASSIDDQLEVGERLPEHALDGGRQIAGVIVDGQEDRDERHGR